MKFLHENQISNYAKAFLKDPEIIELLKTDNYGELFRRAYDNGFVEDTKEILELAGINPLNYIRPEDWQSATYILGEDILDNPTFNHNIFSSMDSTGDIRLIIPRNLLTGYLIAEAKTELDPEVLRMFAEDNVDLLFNSFIEYNYGDIEMSGPELLDAAEYQMDPYVIGKLKKLGYTYPDGRLDQSRILKNEGLIEKIYNAMSMAQVAGAVEEARSDFIKALERAKPDYVSKISINPKNITFTLPLNVIHKADLIDFESRLEMFINNSDGELADSLLKDFAYNLHFSEPSYGWSNFDKSAFNNDLGSFII